MQRACHIVALLMLGGIASGKGAHDPNALYRGRVSELVCQGPAIAPGLKGPHRDDLIIIDDVNDLSGIPEELRWLGSMLQDMYKPMGIVSVGLLSYDNEANRVPDVTLRIFVFKDRPSCEAWRKQKYESEGWEEYYDKVQDPNYAGYHSKQMNKRIAFVNNVWMTCGTISDCNEPVTIVEHYVGLLRRKMKKK
jgi:hypothetical protein